MTKKNKLSSAAIKQRIVEEYKLLRAGWDAKPSLFADNPTQQDHDAEFKRATESTKVWKRDSKCRLSSPNANLQACDVFFQLSPGDEPTCDGGWYDPELYAGFLALPVSEQEKCILRTFVFDSGECLRCEVVSDPSDSDIIVMSFVHD